MKKSDFNPDRIYEIRIKRGFVLTDLATLCGVSPALVHYWEKGKCTPTPKRIYTLAKKLGIEPEYFFTKDTQ
ncbi:MAG: helix-turn-helix transcriptional regulator [Thermodesulfobacteriota bacterium]